MSIICLLICCSPRILTRTITGIFPISRSCEIQEPALIFRPSLTVNLPRYVICLSLHCSGRSANVCTQLIHFGPPFSSPQQDIFRAANWSCPDRPSVVFQYKSCQPVLTFSKNNPRVSLHFLIREKKRKGK